MYFKTRFWPAIATFFLTLLISCAAFAEAKTACAAADGLSYEEVMDRAVDPQSWMLQRDMTWNDYRPNPVIDWLAELNTAGIARPSALPNPTLKTPIKGGLILVEYLDRKFISRGEVGSDPLGYYRYKQNGSGMENTISNNPVYNVPLLIAGEKYHGDVSQVTDADFAQWWADYLNKPQEINHFLCIDEYWRENSYGKWAIDLIPYGPYTIPYFEFETMGTDQAGNLQSYLDLPPSFRRGAAGVTATFGFDNVAIPWIRDKSREETGTTLFQDLDFFFLIHAGYDESGVWQEFGVSQFPSRQDIPYELGPGPRMRKVEEFFTQNPEWLATYATRYGSSAPAANIAFWANEKATYEALLEAGTPELYEFHLQQEDWDWVDGYNNQTQRNTRYVSFTSWEAAVGEWSHMNSALFINTGISGTRSIRYSTQGENDGMASFAHEFSHIAELPDNYGSPWTDTASPLTEPWEIMSRGTFAGPFGDHARWTVPGIEAGSVPCHAMIRNKIVSKFYDAATANPSNTVAANGANANDLLEITVQNLAQGLPLLANVVARNIPLNNKGLYPQLDQYGLYSPNFYKGLHLTFGNAASGYNDKAPRSQTGWSWTQTPAASWMSVEVVERSGYDTYIPGHGVLISRISNESTSINNGNSWNIIDSHLYDIAMLDYESRGDYVAYTLGHSAQMNDAAFHAGTSFNNTGYYQTAYDPADPHYNEDTPRFYDSSYDLQWKKAMLKPGSVMRGESAGGREVASGDTVNEFYDPYNKLHFYILGLTWHKGRTLPGATKPEQFLSYQVGVLHDDGLPVAGDMILTRGRFEPAAAGKYAVQYYLLKHAEDAEASDIFRVAFDDSAFEGNVIVLNNLYALAPGEEISFALYIEAAGGALNSFPANLALTVTSESNPAKGITAGILVTLDANGGTVTPDTLSVLAGGAYGALPRPSRSGYNFEGWYSAPAGGVQVKEGEAVIVDADHTLYARWSGGNSGATHGGGGGAGATPPVTEEEEEAPPYKPLPPLHADGTALEAAKTSDTLLLEGKKTVFPAIKVSGYNWLKLRDFAMLLNGSTKQFSISYDPATSIIDIRSGQAYQPLGDELTDMLDDIENALASWQKLRFNGEFVDVAAYNIKGYNYFRLRDLAIILNFAVSYDYQTGWITLDFANPYKE